MAGPGIDLDLAAKSEHAYFDPSRQSPFTRWWRVLFVHGSAGKSVHSSSPSSGQQVIIAVALKSACTPAPLGSAVKSELFFVAVIRPAIEIDLNSGRPWHKWYAHERLRPLPVQRVMKEMYSPVWCPSGHPSGARGGWQAAMASRPSPLGTTPKPDDVACIADAEYYRNPDQVPLVGPAPSPGAWGRGTTGGGAGSRRGRGARG